MNSQNTKRVIAGIAAVVLIALLLNTFKLYNSNSDLKKSSDQERLKSEKLLSEKLILTKEIDDFKVQIASLQGKNRDIDDLLQLANVNITEKETLISKLSDEAKNAKILRVQLAEIRQVRENLKREIENLVNSNQQLQSKNGELNNQVNTLLAENKSLEEQLRAKSFAGTNFKVEVIKGKKDKLTVKAKRTSKIKIEFEVPANSYPVDSKLVHINLISADGNLQKGDTEVVVENKAELSASLNNAILNKEPQKVIIEFSPDEKLKKGTYTAIVFHKNTFFGNAQFRLMK